MQQESPAKYLVSFDKYLRYYDELLKTGNDWQKEHARLILEAQAAIPELREGFDDVTKLETYRDVLEIVLQDAFSGVLGKNEIKALSLPYHNILFMPSPRLQGILKAAGDDFTPNLRNSNEEDFDYIMACTVILNFYYGYSLDYSRPYFFEIPDAKGVMNYYRVMYNADFVDIIPTENTPEITQSDVDELLEHPEDVEIWKSKFPPGSFVIKGFVLANMFNVTAEHSISSIKSELIASDKRGNENFMSDLQDTFRSFFKQTDLRVGFATYNAKEESFERVYGSGFKSFILGNKEMAECSKALCSGSYKKLLSDKSYFVIPDVARIHEEAQGEPFWDNLVEQGIGSCIFAPIANEDNLLGILEIVSETPNTLNGVNATKLDDVMPYIVSAVVRSKIEEENLIDAVIQHECTTVHESVLWKFKDEARKFIQERLEGREPAFGEIRFDNVSPLYGQVDIRESSTARNAAIQKDLMIHLSKILDILMLVSEGTGLPVYEELIFRVNKHLDEIKEYLHTNSEQGIFKFVQEEINPVFEHIKTLDPKYREAVESYEEDMDPATGSYYDHRRNYDQSVSKINKTLTGLLDHRQRDAQSMFPHYFERYKTDGVEHNMYIGDSLAENQNYNPLYLANLKLWQLQVLVEMENAHYNLKGQLPVPLDVASLILVYNTSLSIRFRQDEKRFDVDGTYNARYEVIKKRIDKSLIKGTRERLTQAGKLSIIYSQKEDEVEYLRYITYLKSKGFFTNNIEIVELEGLQGVAGLKAIRAEILYRKEGEDRTREKELYTYDDLMQELEG